MKLNLLRFPFAGALLIAGTLSLDAAVVVTTTNSDAGSGIATTDLNVNIGITGTASTPSPLFTASGSFSESGTFGGTIGITFEAMKNVSTSPTTMGDMLASGNINRDPAGLMGVGGDPNGGGIGNNATNREGIAFVFDELTNIGPTIGIQITHIDIRNVGRVGTDEADESFTIVNLLTRQSLTFTPVAQSLSEGNFDVTSLNLIGGSPGPVAAIISGDIGGFRVKGLTLETVVIPEPATAMLGLLGAFGLLRRMR